MFTCHIPAEPRFERLRREANHFLKPVGFVEGTPDGSGIHLDIKAGSGEEQNYTLERRTSAGATILTIQSGGISGAANGFHHALRLMGFGFSFFADHLPDAPALQWPYPGEKIAVQPAFAVRGLLPWHNFLNSPTTWNYADYEQYFLTLWRWGANTALFHQYNAEPLTAMRDERGGWTLGEGFCRTGMKVWGTKEGVLTSEFACGTGELFKGTKDGAWGAASCFEKDPIAAAQQEFARACEFADSIGINAALGFELVGDPTAPGAKESVRRRIEHILNTYPGLRILCLWESETLGMNGWRYAGVSPGYAGLERKYGSYFTYLSPAANRVAEGVRLAEWFTFAYSVAKEIRPSIKVAFGGWGGDKWMRWGDYWKGLHEILPTDIALAALDNIDPLSEETVSRSAVGIGGRRALWSIPWLESDGCARNGGSSMWHPQGGVAQMQKLAHSAKEFGYSGLLGIHWQTAGVELTAACLTAAGWDVQETAEEFHRRYASTFFSPDVKAASEVAQILDELEKLGPGWSGTGQQAECSGFSWGGQALISAEKLTPALEALYEKLWEGRDELFKVSTPTFQSYTRLDGLYLAFIQQKAENPGAIEVLRALRERFVALKLASPHARRLLATMDFVLSYEKIRRELGETGRLNRQHEMLAEAKSLGLEPDPKLLADYHAGVREIEATWKDVFAAQTGRLDTAGDFGNLAAINLKAYQAWKQFRDDEKVS